MMEQKKVYPCAGEYPTTKEIYSALNSIPKPQTEMDQLNINIRALRKENGWTQQYVADRLKLKVQTYQAYEEGRSKPTIVILLSIAALYFVEVHHLVYSDILNIPKQQTESIERAFFNRYITSPPNVQKAIELLLKA